MVHLFIKTAARPLFFLPSILGMLVIANAAPRLAEAVGFSPYATCGSVCQMQNQAMFGPFVGNPMMPMGGGFNTYYQTGQWNTSAIYERDRMMAMSMDWNGAQPMGLSYLPPMGVSAIGNSISAGAFGH